MIRKNHYYLITNEYHCLDIVGQMEQAVKESNELLIFYGDKYEFTCNEEIKFIHYRLSLFFYLTSQYDLDRFKKIYILASPPGI